MQLIYYTNVLCGQLHLWVKSRLDTNYRLLRQETVDMMTRDHLHVIGAEPAGLMLAYQVVQVKK